MREDEPKTSGKDAWRETVVENLVANPTLLGLAHCMPKNFAKWSREIARADAIIARREIEKIMDLR